MFKIPEWKALLSATLELIADNRPTLFDVAECECVARMEEFFCGTRARSLDHFSPFFALSTFFAELTLVQ